MMRFSALAVLLLSPASVLAADSSNSASNTCARRRLCRVWSPIATGAIVPNAEVDLVNADGSIAGTTNPMATETFQLAAPHAGSFTLVISEPGFETVHLPVTVRPQLWFRRAAAPQRT